jgi:hypothetical protein
VSPSDPVELGRTVTLDVPDTVALTGAPPRFVVSDDDVSEVFGAPTCADSSWYSVEAAMPRTQKTANTIHPAINLARKSTKAVSQFDPFLRFTKFLLQKVRAYAHTFEVVATATLTKRPINKRLVDVRLKTEVRESTNNSLSIFRFYDYIVTVHKNT